MLVQEAADDHARAVGASMSRYQLARLLRPDFLRHQKTWGFKEVKAQISKYDEGASKTIAGAVLKELQQSHRLPQKVEMQYIQGLARNLTAKGFGIALHVTDAAGVRQQILELAKKRFYAQQTAENKRKRRFDAAAVTDVFDTIADGVDYLVGWSLIPVNMMHNGLQNFMPVDGFDGASARGSGAGVSAYHIYVFMPADVCGTPCHHRNHLGEKHEGCEQYAAPSKFESHDGSGRQLERARSYLRGKTSTSHT